MDTDKCFFHCPNNHTSSCDLCHKITKECVFRLGRNYYHPSCKNPAMIMCEYCENRALVRVGYRSASNNRWREQDLCADCAQVVFNYDHVIIESYLPYKSGNYDLLHGTEAGLNVNNLPALTREQCLELQRSGYQAFTPTLNEVQRTLRGQRISRGKDAHVYLVNDRVIGLMLRE